MFSILELYEQVGVILPIGLDIGVDRECSKIVSITHNAHYTCIEHRHKHITATIRRVLAWLPIHHQSFIVLSAAFFRFHSEVELPFIK